MAHSIAYAMPSCVIIRGMCPPRHGKILGVRDARHDCGWKPSPQARGEAGVFIVRLFCDVRRCARKNGSLVTAFNSAKQPYDEHIFSTLPCPYSTSGGESTHKRDVHPSSDILAQQQCFREFGHDLAVNEQERQEHL